MLLKDDRRLCTDCARYRLGMCQSSVGVWANYKVPVELREIPVRCEGFAEKIYAKQNADQQGIAAGG
jgi:hypothetical protein